jgi:L-asparaginase
MIKSHVHIIKMGGTIEFFDPAYDAINKKLMKLDATIESYLHNLIKPHFNFSTEGVTEKDSRDITEEDRGKLAKAIMASPHQNIIVTHGTFTMRNTAQFLEQKFKGGGRQ